MCGLIPMCDEPSAMSVRKETMYHGLANGRVWKYYKMIPAFCLLYFTVLTAGADGSIKRQKANKQGL